MKKILMVVTGSLFSLSALFLVGCSSSSTSTSTGSPPETDPKHPVAATFTVSDSNLPWYCEHLKGNKYYAVVITPDCVNSTPISFPKYALCSGDDALPNLVSDNGTVATFQIVLNPQQWLTLKNELATGKCPYSETRPIRYYKDIATDISNYSQTSMKAPVTTPTAATVPPPTTSQPRTTQPKVSDTQAYMNQTQDVSVADLANDPNGYTGEKIHVTGVVESYLYDSGGGDPIGINVSDPNDFTSVVYIDLAGFFDPSQVHKGDQIDIWGKGKGVIRGTNQYGGTISLGSMSGLYISNPSNGYTNY